MRISANNGVNWAKIRDSNNDGVVSFSGSIGGNWTVSVAAGTTKPAVGSPGDPIMDLSSLSVSSATAGTLLIEFSETFYGPLPTGNSFTTALESDNIGTGRTTVWSYLGLSNTLFDKGNLLGSIVQTGVALESTVNSGGLPGYAQYSLTMRIAVRHSGAGSSSFSAGLVDPPTGGGVAVPDGGSTVTLLGFALLALGGLATCARGLKRV